MTNYKKQFEDYIDATNKSGSGKAKSYIRALDLLSNILSPRILRSPPVSLFFRKV